MDWSLGRSISPKYIGGQLCRFFNRNADHRGAWRSGSARSLRCVQPGSLQGGQQSGGGSRRTVRRGAGRGRSGRRLEVEGIVGSSSVFSTGSRRWPRVHLLQAQPPPLVSSPLPPHSLQPDPPSAPPLLRTGPAPDSHLVFLQRSLLPARCGRCCTAGRGRAGGGGDDAALSCHRHASGGILASATASPIR